MHVLWERDAVFRYGVFVVHTAGESDLGLGKAAALSRGGMIVAHSAKQNTVYAKSSRCSLACARNDVIASGRMRSRTTGCV
jgi:hypothetical protein